MNTMKLLLVVMASSVLSVWGKSDAAKSDGSTETTPRGVVRDVPPNLALTVNGEVKQEYRFDSTQLSTLPTTRLRTREITSDGDYLGAYAYIGIPLIHILENVEPEKKNADSDRPLDVVVTLTDSNGNQAHFSYGEISMTDDAHPITLAFFREPVVPAKVPENYTKNKFQEAVKGLRLICPGDADVERYLDDVKTITLRTPVVSFEELPVQRRGVPCNSDSLVRCANDGCSPASLEGLEKAAVRDWIRVGHGMGYKGISTASGYSLISFLEKNFPDDRESYFYLFIACDGYHSLFSGSELFKTAAGRESLILTEIDKEKPQGGLTLGPVRDYFVDRDVWGLSHVVQLKP